MGSYAYNATALEQGVCHLSFYLFTDDSGKLNTYIPFQTDPEDDTEVAFLTGVGPDEPDTGFQSHVHEFLGSTKLVGEGLEAHNHRFACMTGEAVYVPGSHVHRLEAKTDYHGHYHVIQAISGPAVYMFRQDAAAEGRDDRKHVHFAEGWTAQADGHRHGYEAATQIEAPLVD